MCYLYKWIIHEHMWIGEYKNDVKNGLGKYTYANGTIYEGEFVNGEFEGTGKCTYPDGDEYVGKRVTFTIVTNILSTS